jgi:NAD+ kinase
MKLSGDTESVFLTLDGQRGIPLQPTDRVRVSRAKELLKLIQPRKKPYFEILRSKLKWGEV